MRIFAIYFQSPILPKDIGNRVDYHCSNHTAAKEVLVHLPSDLSCYCRFKETLLTPSRVVDTSTIYLCRYAIAVFVASMCKASLVGFGRRPSAVLQSLKQGQPSRSDSCERRSHVHQIPGTISKYYVFYFS